MSTDTGQVPATAETERERYERQAADLLWETETLLAEALQRVRAIRSGAVWQWNTMAGENPRFPYLLMKTLWGMTEAAALHQAAQALPK